MNSTTNVSRRDFLKISTLSGTSLILGFALPQRATMPAEAQEEDAVFAPNVFLRIDADGTVTVTVPKSEMGQGVQTALPMILAEELEADWSKIRVEQAPAKSNYGNQVTGGSTSMSGFYSTLRMAGATARTMLIAAAAQQWGVEPRTCRADNGAVVHDFSSQRLTYGELVEIAATLPVPKGSEVTLKSPDDFRIIGTRQGPIDGPDMVSGRAVFASDIRLPGMLYAVVARCPVFGGKVGSFDGSTAEAIPGVRQVVQISSGVAVVAEDTWTALQGRDTLKITWDEGANADLDSETIRQTAIEQLDAAAVKNVNVPAGAATLVEALYEMPYLAHATMEPMVCVADVRADGCDVWAPTQDRMQAQMIAQSKAGVSPVNVHVPLIGGGFGRRLEVDYVAEAVETSKAVGAPVKLVWTRADDIQHDYYRPASYHRLRAGLDAQGLPTSWEHYMAAQPIHGSLPSDGLQGSCRIPGVTRPISLTLPIPTGYWRAVFNTQNVFVSECFLDEIAAAGNKDPYELRMTLLKDSDPLKAVLELAATKADWGTPLPDGWGRGIACFSVWDATPVAQVAEVSVSESGVIKVQRVVCAIDCGTPVNPDMIEAQMESGIVFALTSLLYGEITLKNGRVQQSNFDDYPLLSIGEMPAVEVYIAPSSDPPSGIGEMSNPIAAPAIANAIFAATGRPIRQLPIRHL